MADFVHFMNLLHTLSYKRRKKNNKAEKVEQIIQALSISFIDRFEEIQGLTVTWKLSVRGRKYKEIVHWPN